MSSVDVIDQTEKPTAEETGDALKCIGYQLLLRCTCAMCCVANRLITHSAVRMALAINLIPPSAGGSTPLVTVTEGVTSSNVSLGLGRAIANQTLSARASEREEAKRMLERKRANALKQQQQMETESNGAVTATATDSDALDSALVSSKMFIGYESSSLSLFSSALLELAQSLARLRPAAPIEKVARLISLCPKLPPSRSIVTAWSNGFSGVEAAMRGMASPHSA